MLFFIDNVQCTYIPLFNDTIYLYTIEVSFYRSHQFLDLNNT